MKIVIEIDKEDYERIKTYNFEEATPVGWYAIANGTPLDKIRERISLEKLGYPPSAGYYRAIMKVLEIIDKYTEGSDAE